MNTTSQNIEFIFNYTKKTFNMSLEYIISESNNNNNDNNENNENYKDKKDFKTIIKEECIKNNIILSEANIVLYDYENDYIINSINDFVRYNTTNCSIMIIPVKCNNHM